MGRVVALFAIVLLSAGLSGCQPPPVVGASCMYPSDCRQPLVCRFDRCRNECASNADCPSGATCLLDSRGMGTCGVPQDIGCDGAGRCDDALACALDRCVARCRDATDCPDDGVCAAAAGTSSRVCLDSRSEIPDAEIPDANVRDVGAPDVGMADVGASDVGAADSAGP